MTPARLRRIDIELMALSRRGVISAQPTRLLNHWSHRRHDIIGFRLFSGRSSLRLTAIVERHRSIIAMTSSRHLRAAAGSRR